MQRILYIKETRQSARSNHAGSKARDDVCSVFAELGFEKLELFYDDVERASKGGLSKITSHLSAAHDWNELLRPLERGDKLIVQFPLEHHSLFAKKPFKKLRRRGVELIFLVHDLDLLRMYSEENRSPVSKFRIKQEETSLLNLANRVIVHNDVMKEHLANACDINKENLISLQIFDYLLPNDSHAKALDLSAPIAIAGNLMPGKADYAYELPEGIEYNVYGPNYAGNNRDDIHYKGEYTPEELPLQLEGSFGLVWDGESTQTCSGAYGNYLRINNPHKTSLYLASGLPVIIWSEAALAPFIQQNNLGILVDDLNDLPESLSSLSENEYQKMLDSIKGFSQKLRTGTFTKKAIKEAISPAKKNPISYS